MTFVLVFGLLLGFNVGVVAESLYQSVPSEDVYEEVKDDTIN